MRLNSSALGLLLPAATLLSGCALGNSGSAISAPVNPAKTITGKVFGGQQPVADALIALYTYGNSGYGSAGTLLASATADSSGNFTLDASSINCPAPNTPVYILSIGGDPGFGTNSAVVEGSGLGNCSDAANPNDYVTITEVSTAALAYTFAHFFSATPSGDPNTNDHFGAPADRTQTIINGNNGTLFTLLDVENGVPRANTSTFQLEGGKLNTLGNILGACVNSIGPSSPGCSGLFSDVTGPGGARPANTLEAAVYLALNPLQNVSAIYNLQPPSGGAAFPGGLTAAPADWSLSVSYISPNFGLAVDTRTTSTIDIDTGGHVWFPSNGAGKAGVGYFDPLSGSFSQLFTGNLTHPQQVAIDIDNYVWATDSSSPNVAGFPVASPTTPALLTLPGTTSTSVTVAYDNTIRYGIVAPDGLPALGKVSGKNSYSEIGGTEVPGAGGFIASSLAGDVIGGVGVGGQELATPTTYDLYYSPSGSVTPIAYQTVQDAGQVVFTGNNFVGTRGGYGYNADGICIWNMQGCYGMVNGGIRHPSGLSLDGAASLWLSDTNGGTIEQIPFTNGSYLDSGFQANNVIYTHDSNNGGTLPGPAGIAVDGAGNVWVSNYGCRGNGCTPGAFILSEIIGLGTPTITPVSRQVVIDDLAGTPPQTKTGTSPAK